jgi:hypothetical protein
MERPAETEERRWQALEAAAAVEVEAAEASAS